MIPEFKNTQEALEFAKQIDVRALKELECEVELCRKYAEMLLKTADKYSDYAKYCKQGAVVQLSQAQFCREAIEEWQKI